MALRNRKEYDKDITSNYKRLYDRYLNSKNQMDSKMAWVDCISCRHDEMGK